MFITRGKTKSRLTPGPGFLSDYQVSNVGFGGPWIPVTKASSSINGTQVTESDGNRWPLPKGSDIADSGSEFFTQKTEVLTSRLPHSELYVKKVVSSPSFWIKVLGNFMVATGFGRSRTGPVTNIVDATAPFYPIFPDESSSRSALEVKGTIAVAACNPGNQIANAASSIGELLQDVPRVPGIALWEGRLKALQTVAAGGAEFLNIVFGLSPTINDVTTFLQGVKKVDDRVDHFVRDAGRHVRRSFYFPTEVVETNTLLAGVYSPLGASDVQGGNAFYPLAGPNYPVYETWRKRVTKREIWFSGCFTYHLPDWYETGNREDRIKLMAQLLGAKPDLNTLWQLTPWSWAIDWFSNAGSFVKNLTSLINYGTVMRYGYVMEKCTVTDTYTAGNPVYTPTGVRATNPGPPYPAVHPFTVRTTTKKRVQANPFGFGVSWDGLSTTQQAIVAALGITRVVR